MRKLFSMCTALAFSIMLSGQSIEFQLKVYLQGAYTGGGVMTTHLNTGNHLPLQQPYNTPVWNYAGTEVLSSIPANMVDWILVDLRRTPDTAVARKAFILYSDGSVRDVQGNQNLHVDVPPGQYFVAVMHRSHLSAMSAEKISLPAAGLLNFSDTTAFPIYSRCEMRMPDGTMAMIAGDINHDKTLKYSGPNNDRSPILQRILSVVGGTAINAIINGYYREDLRMDGNVKYSGSNNDPSLIIQNLVNLTGSNAINATFSGPVPHAVFDPFPLPTFNQCGDSLTDLRDGHKYPTVLIGNQCWMAQNLNIGTMVLDDYQGVDHTHCFNNNIIEKYCYNNDSAQCNIYGGLYDWNELMNYTNTPGTQGICPTGWHIPTDAEWYTLTDYLGGASVAGGKMKVAGFDYWQPPNTGATNSSGFMALGAGYRSYNGDFSSLKYGAYFWSSSEDFSDEGMIRDLGYIYANVYRYQTYKSGGFSVRCVLDSIPPCTPQPDQAFAGPDSLNIQGTNIQLQANTPVNGSGQWSVVSGMGGSFADDTLATTQFTGQAGSTYTLAWTVSTVCGSNSDTVVIGFASPQVICPDSLLDNRDGQAYPVVQIGNQCWMGRNLNVGVKVNSQNLGYIHSDVADNRVIEKYCYNNDETNCDVYGGFYDWNEAMEYQTTEGSRGICPSGWHIPTDAEWTVLSDFLGGALVAGGKMKEVGTVHWTSPNEMATNSSGFTGLGSGYRYYYNGTFQNLLSFTYFWTSSADTSGLLLTRTLIHFYEPLVRNTNDATAGFSVRCLMDTMPACSPQPDQANAGPDQLQVQGTSVLLAANQPVNGSGHWRVYSGQGGSFADSTLNNTTFTGMAGATYQLVWIIQNACGYTSDLVNIGFTAVSICPDSLMDARDGQSYPVVEIGSRCWMARNLNYGVMATSVYTGLEHKDVSNDGVIEKYCYNNDPQQCDIYGGLYDWNEAMTYRNTPGIQGACPEGWHLPTDDEWHALVNAAGGTMIAGGNLKESGIAHWLSPNVGATDSFGFTALPGSARYGDGVFSLPNSQGLFWSCTDTLSGTPSVYLLNYDDPMVGYIALSVNNGLSVRCIMDTATACSPLPDAANAGPDMLDIAGLSTNLHGNQAVTGNGVWQILSGTGGSLADSSQATTLFTGQANEYYELSWTISNVCGYSTDKVILSFAGTPSFASCGSVLTDARDGQQYPTILIGNQCWMASNLNIGTFVASVNTGTEHSDVGDNGIIEKYCYDNDANNCLIYGGLYDWNEAMEYVTTPGVKGICPTGWHIPTDAEWKILEGTVDSYFGVGNAEWENGGWRGSDAGGNLKEADTLHWNLPNAGATNSSGFTAMGGGMRMHPGFFNSLKSMGSWWTSSENDQWNSWSRYTYANGATVFRGFNTMASGFSIRCLIDSLPPCTPSPDQADAGPDSLDISGISIQLEAVQPAEGTGAWSVHSGTGGTFTDRTHYNTLFSGQPGQAYQLAWTVTNNCGNTRDVVTVSFLPPPPLVCGDTLYDNRDGQAYPTVQIGTQCWMAKNLNIGTFVNSNAYWYTHSDMYDDMIIEKYCHNNLDSNCLIYGGLYDWNEAMGYDTTPGVQGICPNGWHIPTAEEWDLLSLFLGGDYVAGGLMKDTGTALWATPNQDATNSSGFTAIPGGNRDPSGSFGNLGYNTTWWVSKQYDPSNAWYRDIGYIAGILVNSFHAKEFGFSIRCLSNTTGPCAPQPDQAHAGPDQLNLTGDIALLQANTPSIGTGIWSILSGDYGWLDDPASPNTLLHGTSGETYILEWCISNGCGTSCDAMTVSFSAP